MPELLNGTSLGFLTHANKFLCICTTFSDRGNASKRTNRRRCLILLHLLANHPFLSKKI